ncbi:MAG: 30S ribosomal protein S9 [Saprospiraceae bacterium]|nr:30S ribosomal protein S9 [Saprospiraceae bacterium]MCC7504192.1 30S ribosomal protein S9 [Saprospiraceae bacterium]
MEMINAIGRRKTAVARVYLMKGEGNIVVNGKDYREYFPQVHVQHNVVDPFAVVGTENIYDLKINVRGGGFKGQAEAIRMGVSRALVKLNEEFKKPLKDKKYLTRDSRAVERKKYGKPKARKRFQFSKR